MTTATQQTFQTSVFEKLSNQELLSMSHILHELAEDMEDFHRVQTQGKNIDRSEYRDADEVLGSILS